MQVERFEAWLRAEGLSERTIDSRLSNCRRLEFYEGDLDEHFDSDGLRGLLATLAYSTDDERRGAPARHKVPIQGNVRNGSATLKSGATRYRDFRYSCDGGGERRELPPTRSRTRHRRSVQVREDWAALDRPTDADGQGDLAAVIDAGETDRVEFKETLRVNTHTQEKDPRIENAVLKTIAAFLNSRGGTLFIGVKDDGAVHEVVEIDRFDSEDKMNQHLSNIVNSRIVGGSTWAAIQAEFRDVRGVRILVVRCGRASSPVFVKEKGDGEMLYIRTTTTTERLSMKDALEYIKGRFP